MNWQSYVIKEYLDGRGTSDIAKELKKNSKTIRDVLIKAGIKIRNHSEAQKLFIEKNGPPLNRPRTKKEKKSISDGMIEFWEEKKDLHSK